MKTIKNIASALTLAFVTLAAPVVATAGDIYEIKPCDALGNTENPRAAGVYMKGGETAYFKVRVAKRSFASRQFDLHYVGTGSEAVDIITKCPAIGIYVNGKFTVAKFVTSNQLSDDVFTDFVFSYAVTPGDFALPIRLADADKNIINEDQSSAVTYYLNFRDTTLGKPVWDFDDATTTESSTCQVEFNYGTPDYSITPPDGERVRDYDLTKCNFSVKTIDFDANDPAESTYWRTVHANSTALEGTLSARLVVEGLPTNAVSLYLWSTDESAVRIYENQANVTKKQIHFDGPDGVASDRYVLKIDVVAGKGGEDAPYEFQLYGVTKQTEAQLVLSAFDDFSYKSSGYVNPVLVTNFLVKTVRCSDPLPASVTIAPTLSKVKATSVSYLHKVTELNVAFSEAFTEAVTMTIVPEFSAVNGDGAWSDYVRFAATPDEDVSLQTKPIAEPTIVIDPNQQGGLRPYTLNGEQLTDGKIYIYTLRGDKWSDGTAATLTLKVTTDNPKAILPSTQGGIDGWGKKASLKVEAEDPVIESMFGGTDAASAIADSARTLEIVISDTWADTHCNPEDGEGYEIWIVKDTDSSNPIPEQVPGLFKPGKGNMLYLTNSTSVLPSVSYSGAKDVYSSKLYVKSPISGNQSAYHAFQMTVKTPDRIVCEYDDSDHAEGDEVEVKIHLEDADGKTIKNTQGDLYVFLQPDSSSDLSGIYSKKGLATNGVTGVKFANYATSLSEKFVLQLLDGDESKSGLTFSYSVVFLDCATWPATEAEVEKHKVSAYKNNEPIVLTVFNVIPSIDSISINDGTYEIFESGTGVEGKFPAGVENTLSAIVTEPGEIDRTIGVGENDDPRFQVRWRFTDSSGFTTNIIVRGDPDDEKTVCKYDFPTPGTYKVRVDLHDKDMGKKYGNGEVNKTFDFTVEVIDQPAITIEHLGNYVETDSIEMGGEASFDVVLGLNNINKPLVVNLLVTPADATSEAPGELVFQTGSGVEYKGTTNIENVVYESYDVTFSARSLQTTVYLEAMDGTASSKNYGFKIIPSMVSKDVDPQSGKRADEYYLGVEPKPLKVINVAPVLDPEYDVYPVPGTNVFSTAAGLYDETITWSFTDVTADFSRGIKVEFKGGGGWGPNTYTNADDAIKAGEQGFTPNFSGMQGDQQVKLLITDPDKGVTTVLWKFYVEASKSMKLVPHGPTTGLGAGNGDRYASKADGLGEGRVWAKSKSDIAVNYWNSTINCGLEKSWTVYAYGYKVGDVDGGANRVLHYPDGRTGYYDGRDTPIDASGSNYTSGEAYRYVAREDKNGNPVDSFLYTWLTMQIGDDSESESGDAYLNETTAPEQSEVADNGRIVTLPTEEDEEGGYQTTLLEAVFSIEYLASDNMGDINLDGIPDVYAKKFADFGICDTEGKVTGDDLTKLSGFNDDEDYLPSSDTAVWSTFIPGLAETWGTVGVEFSAKLELRGYHEGLNDATAKPYVTVPGVKPDLVYAVEDEDGKWGYDEKKCSISELEYLAWRDYAAVNGLDWTNKTAWASWSPERPSDPTLEDTDEDGFPDGYEYYFWYKAHVGYLDNGVHKYLTGRRYNPRNPGSGDVIQPAEVEALFDPIDAGDLTSAETRDSDNDGLADILEFTLGTNPVDFDTDGDGLPDGFEILLSGTDPLTAYSVANIHDAGRNYDGDAMAITSPKLEESTVRPTPKSIDALYTFSLVDANGDTDGVQWYVAKTKPTEISVEVKEDGTPVTVNCTAAVTVGGKTYVTTGKVGTYAIGSVTYLGGALAKDKTWLAVPVSDESVKDYTNAVEGVDYIRFAPTYVPAGSIVSKIVTKVDVPAAEEEAEPTTRAITCASLVLSADVTDVMTAWVYGNAEVTDPVVAQYEALASTEFIGQFGNLVVGRYPNSKHTVAKGRALASIPAADDTVAYIHAQVYQEFAFDPRTAWKPAAPLAARWSSKSYAKFPSRTRAFTAYDEFLLLSYWLNTGVIGDGDVVAAQPEEWYKIWSKYTTNAQGPSEPSWEEDEHYKGRTAESASGTNGADTDQDGIPDGWELYVMAGPKDENGNFVFASPTGVHSPLKDIGATLDNGSNMTFLRNFGGTDSCNYYSVAQDGNEAAYSTTVVRQSEDQKWLNKFFPTDPWVADTDLDGIPDQYEGGSSYVLKGTKASFSSGSFVYGTPADSGALRSIPGAGLNPCAVDTDEDGLPDGWESQFAGTPASVYTGADADYSPASDGSQGNPLQGLTDGMDGTVPDALNYVHVTGGENESGTGLARLETVSVNSIGAQCKQVVNRDYDRDGLENWQEYLVGTMRCWRYDDPLSRWGYIAQEMYFDDEGIFRVTFGDTSKLAELGIDTTAKDGGVGEFWYKTLFDKSSKIYNPHLVTDTSSGAQYFTRVTNGWDPMFSDEGTYYVFCDRINETYLAELWGYNVYGNPLLTPYKYISCSPVRADTDQDGMDDYYELFHGMNPLLGATGVASDSGAACDIVYDAWFSEDLGTTEWANIGKTVNASPFTAEANYWTDSPKARLGREPRVQFAGNVFDFELFPWLNGLASADPDGDDIRNQEESIMPMVAPASIWHHTDPTPLWMTDSSYTNSLVHRFFRSPATFGSVQLPGATFEYGGKTIPFCDRDGYYEVKGLITEYYLAPFAAEQWGLASAGAKNWVVSFEENEGFDTDHDGTSDFEELQGALKGASDPQNFDSPHRRQAMYFPGENAALQSMPFVAEDHPRRYYDYDDDMAFVNYTVECWALPEDARDATLIERGVWAEMSNGGDQELLRRNFQIAVRNGKWYTCFDTAGTLSNSIVCVESANNIKVGEWTHVAATFGGGMLTLYVNGEVAGSIGDEGRGLKPEYGASAVVVHPAETASLTNGVYFGREGVHDGYWFDREYSLKAFLIGASFKGVRDLGGIHSSHLNVMNGVGWNRYKNFFKGYVDEVRVWDGARSASDIKADMKVRYTADLISENREAFYEQWSAGMRRYNKDASNNDMDMIPELRFHWSFDSVPGAENAGSVAKAPHGFGWFVDDETFYSGEKTPYSRPVDYVVGWYKTILDGYTGTVYDNPAWVTWIPNTVTHLPRFDGTTLDSAYWSSDFAGETAGSYSFANTAEPFSRWTQYVRHRQLVSGVEGESIDFDTTSHRYLITHAAASNSVESLATRFAFTGRHLNQSGDDLIPLGGAFVKYIDQLWDEQGASTAWEQTGDDVNVNDLPDWWEEYAKENYLEDAAEADAFGLTTIVRYEGSLITAREAYLRDIARGYHCGTDGNIVTDDDKIATFVQLADEDDDGMSDWWEEMMLLHTVNTDLTVGHGDEDPDGDGLSNYAEYIVSELLKVAKCNPKLARTDGVREDYFLKMGDLYLGELFSDHDMIDDDWEGSYPTVANRYLYDPNRDDDSDGWSNYAEYRAGTDPSTGDAAGVDEYTRAEHPVPIIEAKVVYNGSKVNFGSVVFKAWNEKADADMISAPDAIWTIGNGAAAESSDEEDTEDNASASTLEENTKYLGKALRGTQRYLLGGGTVAGGSVAVKFLNKNYISAAGFSTTGTTNVSQTAGSGTITKGDPSSAEWYLTAQDDDNGNIVTLTGVTVGSIDYKTGVMTIDFDNAALKGETYGDPSLKQAYSSQKTATDGRHDYDLFSLDTAHVLVSWEAKLIGLNATGTYYLGNPDEALVTDQSRGHLREGANTFVCFVDTDGNGAYTAGEPFGVTRGVEVGWQGASFTIQIGETDAISPRLNLWDGLEDRHATFDGTLDIEPVDRVNGTPSNRVVTTYASNDKVLVRVVRYGIDDQFAYNAGVYESGLGMGFDQRVVMEKQFDRNGRDLLCEADFLGDGLFDIDWGTMTGEIVDADGNAIEGVAQAGLDVTNMSYLVVVGEGPKDFRGSEDTNTVVAAVGMISRRFDAEWARPVNVGVRGGGDISPAGIVYCAHPTFVWSMPDESAWAKRFGSSYTAFTLRIRDVESETEEIVYDSGVVRAPAQDADGNFVWTAPISVGDMTPQGKIFRNCAKYEFEVAMFNAKFQPSAVNVQYSVPSYFSTSVKSSQVQYDARYFEIDAAVKYVGPTVVLSKCEDMTAQGKVRVQAFETADFSGVPAAETYLADRLSLTNALDTAANVSLIGLAEGTYYLRAFIDMNGNRIKDDFESWGYFKESVVVGKDVRAGTDVRFYIEDADTNGNWYPDAWEYVAYGKWRTDWEDISMDAPEVGPNAKLVVSSVVYDSLTNSTASGSKGLYGVPVTVYQQSSFANMLLAGDLQSDEPTAAAMDAIRQAVEKKVVDKTLRITSITFDAAAGEVVLAIDADIDYVNASAGNLVSSLYDLTLFENASYACVTVKVYRKATLAQADWELVNTVKDVKIGSDEVAVTVKVNEDGDGNAIDLASGFYKVEIEQ